MAAIKIDPPEIEEGGIITVTATGLSTDADSIHWWVQDPDIPVDESPGVLWNEDEDLDDGDDAALTKWDTTGLEAGSYEVGFQLLVGEQVIDSLSDSVVVKVRPVARDDRINIDMGGGPVAVTLKRTDFVDTDDEALWYVIRQSVNALSYERYEDFINWIFCGVKPGGLTAEEHAKFEQGKRKWGDLSRTKSLPFPDIEPYRLLKVATEVFLMVFCGVMLKEVSFKAVGMDERERLGLSSGADLSSMWTKYLEQVNGNAFSIPYLDLVRRKLGEYRLGESGDIGEKCYSVLRAKFTMPCFLELIWSYWHEEGMLIQTMNALSTRFQNKRGPQAVDPLVNLELDPLRPLNNLLWGYIQDEQHRLTVPRRAYEYDHHYGLMLYGKAVPTARTADSRSRFLEAFHNVLHRAAVFYKEDDDTTMIADPFPVLNALREVHLLLAEGAHNQYGDLPWTARQEMLMEQWLLARPEFREFLPMRVMVVYPEPWMDRVDAMKKVQGWTDTSVRHFRDLAVTGEPILLSIRFGNWSDVIDRNSAANWARYWRQEVQWYIQAYQTVTGVDLSADTVDVGVTRVPGRVDARYAQPAVHLSRRLAEQRARQTVRA